MPVFSVIMTSALKVVGVVAARESYNEKKRPDDPSQSSIDEYVQCASHVQQYGT